VSAADAARPTVAVTGIAGNLGRALARHLAGPVNLLGIDHRPFPAEELGVEHWQVDLRKARVEEPFTARRVDALVHMGIVHDRDLPTTEVHDLNVVGTRRILDLCERHGVKKVIVLSSANVYGPAPDNSSFLAEETPLLATARRGDMRDLVEIDMYAQSFLWRHPEIETVVLRPVNVIGPTVRNAPADYLRLERPLTALGFDPMLQLIHEEDVCRALALGLRPGVRGVFNVVGPGELPLSAILRELGRDPIPIPHFLLRPMLRFLQDGRGSVFPPEDVDHLQFACTVDGSRAARELGWAPSRTLRETIRSVLEPARPHPHPAPPPR
jgi:UDP-glucose 4-epimerase